MDAREHKFIFIVGLHRSGTTVLADILSDHSDVSSFRETGFPKDEGQFLQTVFPPAAEFGGPGKFGFDVRAHLTEESPLCTVENRDKLLREWGRYWDISKPFLLEKSPPNILKTRFLNALFPGAYFVVILRHPIAVSMATRKWSKTSMFNLIRHWLRCHEILYSDLRAIENKIIVKYEDFVAFPDREMFRILDFIGLKPFALDTSIVTDSNKRYFENWRMKNGMKSRIYKTFLKARFERSFARFGYSFP
jgi:hypothetical protein